MTFENLTIDQRRMLLERLALRRRVFFSFHYQNDFERANQVRNSWKLNHPDRLAFGFYDASIWETAQRTNEESLKSLIREGISNTSVTCVLAGTETFRRRWVRYELARSLVKKNGLLCVRIHNLGNRFGFQSMMGPNPLDYIGVYQTRDQQTRIAARNDALVWEQYSDYTLSIDLPATWIKPIPAGPVIALSVYGADYNYLRDNGPNNFSNWVAAAAATVGR